MSSHKNTLVLIVFSILFTLSGLSQKVNEDQSIASYVRRAPFKMPEIIRPIFPDKSFSIAQYGAIGNGQILNTVAFEKTIQACALAGGGKVVVPAGLWLTGPIQLKSNINLEVQRGALIIFTKDHSQYPIIKGSNTSNNFVVASPIYAYDCKNIAITGEGIIDGGGESWRPVKKIKTTAAQWKELNTTGVVNNDGSVWWPSKEAMDGEGYLKDLKQRLPKATADDYLPARDFMRPYMCYLVNCENILIENVTIRNSPKFVFYPNYCTNIIMDHVNIFNEWWAQNGDGIDISASKNVIIYKCNVSVGDDGICMKSSGGGTDRNIAMLQNIIIAGCNVYHAHGGFVIGSNTDGGINNVFVSDCNFVGTDVGIRVKSNAGRGGLVHNIFIDKIFMRDIVNEAILFDTYYEDVPAGKSRTISKSIKEKTPEFMDFHINEVYCNGAKTAIAITGLPEMPVHNIYFSNINISSLNGVVATDAGALDLKHVVINSAYEPVYQLRNVKGVNIEEGYFSPKGKIFVKGDNKTEAVKVSLSDKRDIKNAILLDK